MSIMCTASKLGLSRPNIRGAKLKKLLKPTTYNAYWWGFIMADGYLSKKGALVVRLSTRDKEHLAKISELLSCNITYTHRPTSMCSIEVMDRINGIKLKKHLGITERKTYNPPTGHDFLCTKEARLAFFVGFSDGDGCITFNSAGVFKSLRIVVHANWYQWFKNFCSVLEDDYPNLKFTVSNTNKRGNTYIYIGKKRTLEFFQNFIKENELPVMERKWYTQVEGTDQRDISIGNP